LTKRKVSDAVIRRLPKYYRYLDELHENGITRISSHQLADEMGFTASQIRQDLNCFGGFGQQGYGYGVEKLRSEISAILGLQDMRGAILIGAGNLGRALLGNFDFESCGFRMLAAFDVASEVVGKKVNGVDVLALDSLDEFIKAHSAELAVLTMPGDETREIAKRLEALGVKGVWNFTSRELRADETNMCVETVHFTESLMALCYKVNEEGKA